MNSTPIVFIPHPALYGTAPPPKPPSPSSPYERLKQLDETLDRWENSLAEARRDYQKALQEFATQCLELWKQEKSQGSRQGKGFRSKLQSAGIKAGRAYRAMKKFFPADFPARPKPLAAKGLTSSAADEVGLRFTGQVQDGKEVLQCTFALSPEEKAEFVKCLELVGAGQVQRLLLEAVKQAAATLPLADEQSEIASKACPRGEPASRTDAPCNIVAPADALPVPISSDGVTEVADVEPGSPSAGIPPAAEGQKREASQSENAREPVLACPGLPWEAGRSKDCNPALSPSGMTNSARSHSRIPFRWLEP